jgi:hypothetical protein
MASAIFGKNAMILRSFHLEGDFVEWRMCEQCRMWNGGTQELDVGHAASKIHRIVHRRYSMTEEDQHYSKAAGYKERPFHERPDNGTGEYVYETPKQ